MQSAHINPFLLSATHVIEQLCSIKPTRGDIKVKILEYSSDFIWLQIHIFGQMKGDIVFGFPEKVALKLVSGMMGGSTVTEFDEMSQSAISELGNMISGNASTMLFNDGIEVDITPPKFISKLEGFSPRKAISIPLSMETVGDFEICVITL